ncbi:MAG: hypothetical protein EAZ95_03160 [Bacteroidetes bacterium]|nr:MAG: hypothetical protein EAZ95_03160 [Bacteroidota bacterium]
MKPFEKWKTEEVETVFGMWLAYQQPLDAEETKVSERLRTRLQSFADFWNEEDIKVFFLMPLIDVVNFYDTSYRTFMETTFQATLTDAQNNPCTLRGRVEMLVAMGKQDPKTPFFFLNEYKPQIKAQSDPKGQLLSAMVAAQALNNGHNFPVYGLYNIRQNLYFVILVGKEYTVSPQFNAMNRQELDHTINMLRFVKKEIEGFVKILLKK